uniref:Uncharacterized protein n=1 Tax=Nelumbo nucifera TaxID=4432 RepID=A0A822YKZ1_NELNU|nr:TPA_asm: hypothetical protein HUJ06_010810 [Nelumbo nucifera]
MVGEKLIVLCFFHLSYSSVLLTRSESPPLPLRLTVSANHRSLPSSSFSSLLFPLYHSLCLLSPLAGLVLFCNRETEVEDDLKRHRQGSKKKNFGDWTGPADIQVKVYRLTHSRHNPGGGVLGTGKRGDRARRFQPQKWQRHLVPSMRMALQRPFPRMKSLLNLPNMLLNLN